MNKSASKKSLYLITLTSFLILLLAPFIGSTNSWSAEELLFSESVASEIFWRIRVPRVLLGFIAGAALGGAGAVFQAVFRNPLASPYTLGVSSGAAFGAVASIKLGLSSLLFGVPATVIGGLCGALLSTVLVYLLYTKAREVSGTTMLLSGVVMSFFFSSLMLFLQYFSDFRESFEIIRWLMGGLETIDFTSALSLLPFVALGLSVAWIYSRELDALSTGDELAYSRGVDVKRLRVKLFFTMSLMIGAVVSFVGPIGFVGIIVPHFTRALLGPSHKSLIPATTLASGGFLVLCDCGARFLLAPAEIPVGVITALCGGPFFLLVLLYKKRP